MDNRTTIICRKVNSEYIEAHYDELVEGLYEERRERVKKLKNKKAAYESITSGYLLQDICKSELNLTPGDIKIINGEHGKPELSGFEHFRFNLSHTEGMVALAYGGCELGTDIERVRPHDLKVAGRCFCKSEYDYVVDASLDDPDACRDELKTGEAFCKCRQSEYARFFHIWTVKEAYLKYKGNGISVPLNSFEIDGYNGCFTELDEEIYTTYTDGYIISVCGKRLGEIKLIVN